jgi:hypothetical protein
MAQEGSILYKIGHALSNEPRLVYLLLFIISFAGAYFPLPLPSTPVDSWSQAVFDSVEALQPGDVVMIYCAFATGNERCNYIGINAMFRHIWARGAGIISNTWIADTVMVLDEIMSYKEMLNITDINEMPNHPIYGTQLVDLGYIAGSREANFYKFASDMHGVVSTDRWGTPLEDIPMMQDVRDGGDVELVVTYGSYGPPSCWNIPIGSFYLQYGTPCIGTGEGEIFTEAAYLQQCGLLKGLGGCALGQRQYEALVIEKYGVPNYSYPEATQILYQGIFVIVAMLIHNIWELVIKKEG